MRHGLAITQLPKWAQEEVRLRREVTSLPWDEADPFREVPKRYTRVVHIAYPNQVHYVIQKLEEGEWVYTEPLAQLTMFWTPLHAEAAAQKKAYMTQTPHRVLEVVWDG